MIDYKYKPSFLKELKKIPKIYIKTLENLVFNKIPSTNNPFSLKILNKMKGYQDYYKINKYLFLSLLAYTN